MKPAELNKKLNRGGVNYMVVTPFHEDQTVDYEGLKENVAFLLDKIKDFDHCTITPAGSNGEFAHLNDEELKKVIKTCTEAVDGKKVVIAGTGRSSAFVTAEISRYAQSVGVDGLQIILPYYFIPTEQGMYEHFEYIASQVDVGMVVYNNPAFTASWVNPPLMKRMVDGFGQNGKIAGIKENTPHLMLFNSMMKTMKGSGVPIFSGFGEQWYAYQFPWGAAGLATPFGNFFPEFPRDMYLASLNHDIEAMRKLLDRMDPYYAFVGKCSAARKDTGIYAKPGGAIYGEGNIRFAVVKAAMNLMGLRGGRMRLPIEDISAKEKDELKDVLKAIGLL